MALPEQTQQRITRWRLILGQESQPRFEQMGGEELNEEQSVMDRALASIYNRTEAGGFGAPGRQAGSGPSNPQISRWLGDIRSLFEPELVKVIQGDAMTRCGLQQLIFEPELLDALEPDVDLAATILLLKEQVPARAKENVRAYIRKIVEKINRLLDQEVRRAVTSSLNRRQHSPIPSASALDYQRTIRRNLKHYSPQLGTILPEKFYFFDRSTKTAANRRQIILAVDQSGSMAQSVIYASVLSCILASMASLRTHVVAFDTKVVDLTEKCSDPIDLLYGFQLGGGTDIERAVAYCQTLVENPSKTLMFLITDLEEGGNRAGLLRRLQQLKADGVTVVCLLALADGGRPYYDAQMAQRVAALDIPCFACNPEMLPRLLALALCGQDVSAFQKELERRSE